VSELPGSEPAAAAKAPGQGGERDGDALPVLAETATVIHAFPPRADVARRRGSAIVALPAVQAAAMAAGGFVAGAAMAGLAHRRSRAGAAVRAGRSRRGRAGRRGRRRAGRGLDIIEIVGSRSLLLDVHLLGAPAQRPGR
jgi:hypothetical protein